MSIRPWPWIRRLLISADLDGYAHGLMAEAEAKAGEGAVLWLLDVEDECCGKLFAAEREVERLRRRRDAARIASEMIMEKRNR